jgi:hypothetical protein
LKYKYNKGRRKLHLYSLPNLTYSVLTLYSLHRRLLRLSPSVVSIGHIPKAPVSNQGFRFLTGSDSDLHLRTSGSRTLGRTPSNYRRFPSSLPCSPVPVVSFQDRGCRQVPGSCSSTSIPPLPTDRPAKAALHLAGRPITARPSTPLTSCCGTLWPKEGKDIHSQDPEYSRICSRTEYLAATSYSLVPEARRHTLLLRYSVNLPDLTFQCAVQPSRGLHIHPAEKKRYIFRDPVSLLFAISFLLDIQFTLPPFRIHTFPLFLHISLL